MTTKVICPECGSSNCYYRKTSDSWRCRRCKESFVVGSDVSGAEPEEVIRPPQSNNVQTSVLNKGGFWAKLRGLFGSRTN